MRRPRPYPGGGGRNRVSASMSIREAGGGRFDNRDERLASAASPARKENAALRVILSEKLHGLGVRSRDRRANRRGRRLHRASHEAGGDEDLRYTTDGPASVRFATRRARHVTSAAPEACAEELRWTARCTSQRERGPSRRGRSSTSALRRRSYDSKRGARAYPGAGSEGAGRTAD